VRSERGPIRQRRGVAATLLLLLSSLFDRGWLIADGGEPGFDRLHERLPAAGSLGRLLQELERLRPIGRQVVGLARIADRGLLVREPRSGDFHELGQELELVAFVGLADQHLVERRQARPLFVLFVERDQRARSAGIARIGGQDAFVAAKRARPD
jgi:hypothetical protein